MNPVKQSCGLCDFSVDMNVYERARPLASWRALRDHFLTHNPVAVPKKFIKCGCCNVEFTYHIDMANHQSFVAPVCINGGFICTLCPVTVKNKFFHLTNAMSHVYTTHKTRAREAFTCCKCGDSFFFKSSLLDHCALRHWAVYVGVVNPMPTPQPVQDDEPKHICVYCGIEFNTWDDVLAHIVWTHQPLIRLGNNI